MYYIYMLWCVRKAPKVVVAKAGGWQSGVEEHAGVPIRITYPGLLVDPGEVIWRVIYI